MPRNPTRTLQIAAYGFVIALILILLPLLLPHTQLNKFLVAIGLLLACWSISCTIHGLWDLWRER